MKDKVCLVTGACGYIGSHMVKKLLERGFNVVAIDNLSRSSKIDFPQVPLYIGDIGDKALVDEIFLKHSIHCVYHFAAFAYVSESVEKPADYYHNNFIQTKNLLDIMCLHKVNNIIFSSSCATYGEAKFLPIDENHPQNPINALGRTKLMVEWLIKDYSTAYGLKYIILRYFNVSGSDPNAVIGENHNPETHLIPSVLLTALGKRENFYLYGIDYPTTDGTCIRDYIHVEDLVDAHLLGMYYISSNNTSNEFNLGSQKGYSIKEVLDVAEKVTETTISIKLMPKRSGDPAILYADSTKAIDQLKWKPKYSNIETIVNHTWNWLRRNSK